MEDQTPSAKRNFGSRISSASSSDSPVSKKPKDSTCEASDVEESDEVFQALNMSEHLARQMEQISQQLKKLDAIEEKIQKLDSIESKIESFSIKLTEVEKAVASLRCEQDASKEKQATMQRSINELKDSAEFNDARVDSLELKSFKLEKALTDAKEDLKKRSLYLEAYSRRENLKFAGVPESKDEQVKDVLMEFLEKQLGIEQPEEIEYQRIHRIGKMGGERPRMIIARFLRYADRERVIKQAYKLKGTDFTIYDDIPKDLVKERKKLMPLFHEAKKAGKKAVFSKSEPDKLYIDGKRITV